MHIYKYIYSLGGGNCNFLKAHSKPYSVVGSIPTVGKEKNKKNIVNGVVGKRNVKNILKEDRRDHYISMR